MADRPRFGPAGRPIGFKGKMRDVPSYLREKDLEALEYQAVRGVKISEEAAVVLGENAQKYDCWLTLHGPYFINLSSDKPDTVEKSKVRLINSLRAAYWMGAHQVVFHPGYYGSYSHDKALKMCIGAISGVIERAKAEGITRVYLGPETTGKKTQVGSLDETLAMCESVDLTMPTIDLAHIHAREGGVIKTKDDYIKIIDTIENRLGTKAIKNLHIHFTRVEFTMQGEKRHHTMEEKEFGPDFKPFAEIVVEQRLKPVIISESPILDHDAIKMRGMFLQILKQTRHSY